jgi:hypothetical protein
VHCSNEPIITPFRTSYNFSSNLLNNRLIAIGECEKLSIHYIYTRIKGTYPLNLLRFEDLTAKKNWTVIFLSYETFQSRFGGTCSLSL